MLGALPPTRTNSGRDAAVRFHLLLKSGGVAVTRVGNRCSSCSPPSLPLPPCEACTSLPPTLRCRHFPFSPTLLSKPSCMALFWRARRCSAASRVKLAHLKSSLSRCGPHKPPILAMTCLECSFAYSRPFFPCLSPALCPLTPPPPPSPALFDQHPHSFVAPRSGLHTVFGTACMHRSRRDAINWPYFQVCDVCSAGTVWRQQLPQD